MSFPGTPFAKDLLTQIQRRQSILIENEALRAAIFLDPRFQYILTEDEKEKAVHHLCQVWLRHSKYLEKLRKPEENATEEKNEEKKADDDDDDDDTCIEETENIGN